MTRRWPWRWKTALGRFPCNRSRIGSESQKTYTYNFTVPESEIYEEAILLCKFDFDNSIYYTIKEDGKQTSAYGYKGISSYRLSSKENKTITLTISKQYNTHNGIFVLLDVSLKLALHLKQVVRSLGFG